MNESDPEWEEEKLQGKSFSQSVQMSHVRMAQLCLMTGEQARCGGEGTLLKSCCSNVPVFTLKAFRGGREGSYCLWAIKVE